MSPYISSNGRIVRDRENSISGTIRSVSWTRVLLVCIVAAVFIVTNPANEEWIGWKTGFRSNNSRFAWHSQDLTSVTNFLFFSVEETIRGVTFVVLQKRFVCNYGGFSFTCETFGPPFVHQKPLLWDESDRVHTAHRIICWLLFLSAVVSFCCPNKQHSRGRLSGNIVVDGLASIFHRSSPLWVWWDLVFANVAVHPAIQELNKVVPKLNNRSILSTGDPDWDFVLGVLILVAVIGGGTNTLVNYWCGRRHDYQSGVFGFNTVVAASLAYYQRIVILGEPILFYFGHKPVKASGIYWAIMGTFFLGQKSQKWFPQVFAWLFAGWLGSLLAKYHLENMAVVGDILKFFGIS